MKFTVDTRNRDFVNSLTDQTSAVIPALTLGDKFTVAFEFGKDGSIDESIGALDTVEVALSSCVTPDRGTFRLFPPGGPITGDPITLPETTSAKALASAIAAAWDGVSLSDLCVTGGNGFFRVEFQGSLADTEIDPMTGDGTKLSPRSVVSVNQKEAGGGGQNAVQIISLDSVPLAYTDDLTFDDGVFSGILNVDTVAANEAMREAGKGRVSRLLSVRVTDDEGNRTTYAKRPVIVDCTGIPMGPFGAGALAQYLTLAQGDNRYDRTGIDIRRFGAVGDGETDDAPAIQEAVDAAEADGGGVVFIPPPAVNYRVVMKPHPESPADHMAAVLIPDNVSIVGAGYASWIRLTDNHETYDDGQSGPKGGGIFMQKKWGVGNLTRNVFLHNLRLDMNHANQTVDPSQEVAGQWECIDLMYVEDWIIDRLWLMNSPGDGIDLDFHCYDTIIRHCHAENTGGFGFHITNTLGRRNDAYFNTTRSCGIRQERGGIDTKHGGNRIIGHKSIDDYRGVVIQIDDWAQNPGPVLVSGCHVWRSKSNGIAVAGAQETPALITGNTLHQCGQDGGASIRCASGHCQVIGNNLFDNKSEGIRFINNGTFGSILNNHIDGTGDLLHGINVSHNHDRPTRIAGNYIQNTDRDGIVLSSARELTTIENNVIANANRHGINPGAPGTIIRNNRISGSTFNNINSPAGHVISGNVGFVTESKGTAEITTGNTTVAVPHGLDYGPDAEDFIVQAKGSLGSAASFDWAVNGANLEITLNADPTQTVEFVWRAARNP